MNYQFPLMNLVTRGHLKVKNPIGAQKFIEQLDNDSCQTILENLIFVTDPNLCTRMLEDVQESYELKHNIRHSVSDRTLGSERDKVLLKEDAEDQFNFADANADIMQNVKTILKFLKIGLPTAAIFYIARIPKEQRDATFKNLEMADSKASQLLRSSPLFRKILPEEGGFFTRRLPKTLWTLDKSHLKPSDADYLRRLGRGVTNIALLGAGITAALVGISIAYKEFFSAEAKKCKGYTGKSRTICMCNAIIEAAEKAKAKSEDMLLKCDSAKDPQDCRYKLKCEIRSWMKKIEEQKRKLARIETINKTAYAKKPQNTTPVKVSPAYDPFGDTTPDPVKTKQPVKEIPVDPIKSGNPFENNSVELELDPKKPHNPFA